MGILLALVSMLCAGINDALFKRFITRPGQGMGWFISGIGLVMTVVFGLGVMMSGHGMTLRHWPLALGGGLASLLANVLLIGSLRSVSAGTGATVYRLNLVLVALLSFFLLHESITASKLTGIGFGIAAVLTVWERPAGEVSREGSRSGWILLLLAASLRAVMAILYTLAGSAGIPLFEVLFFTGVCWLVGGGVYALLLREPQPSALPRLIRYCLISGVLVCGIASSMLAAVRLADTSVVIPIAQMSFVVTTLLGIAFLGEAVSLRKWLALLAAAVCIVVLCLKL